MNLIQNNDTIAQNKSYNQIIKAFGLFGGVQVFTILITIIRSKFVAVLLGTAGLGVLGLLTSTIGMISAIANLGLNVSAVNTISKVSNTNDPTLISRTIITIRRWISFTGVFGAIITLVLASKLSQWVFGNNEYVWAFVWLSINIFFQALITGQSALLQGLRLLKQLAKVGVIGSSVGLFISLSLFYFYGLKGIVPSLILTATCTSIISWYYVRSIMVENINVTMRESFYDGLDMLKLGGVFLVTNLFGTGVLYIIQIFINKTGGIEQVGLYISSFAIINGYFGMIFTAMGTDLFPRLAAISKDNYEIKILINQQSIIMILILAPLLIFLISMLPLVVKILLTVKFLPIIQLLKWAILGVVFQAIGYPFGLTIAAKGQSKTYFVLVMALHFTTLLTYAVLYHFLKLEGIGIAYLFVQGLFLLILIRYTKVKYSFSYNIDFIKIFCIQLFLIVLAFIAVWFGGYPIAYITGFILTVFSFFFSYLEFKKRVNLNEIVQKIRKR